MINQIVPRRNCVYFTLFALRCQLLPWCVGRVVVMPRHKAMKARSSGGRPQSDAQPEMHEPINRLRPPEPGEPVLAPMHPSMDLQRYEQLADVRIRRTDPLYTGPALESARRLWSRLPGRSESAGNAGVSTVARYLAAEAARIGQFNYAAALKRTNVDRYIDEIAPLHTSGTIRAARVLLYEAGRLVHPNAYPQAQGLSVPHPTSTVAATHRQIQELYAIAPGLPGWVSRKLLVMLDLSYGAGARTADLMTLRGGCISAQQWGGKPVALVRLPNLAGGTRVVPVADEQVSERLIALAQSKGDNLLIPSRDRNAVNRVGGYLRERGYAGVTAQALRNRWLIDLSARAPVALMMQLADTTYITVLNDHRQQLPTFSTLNAIAILKETQ